MFDTLYRDACECARKELDKHRLISNLPVPGSDIVSLIRDKVDIYYSDYKKMGSSKELHLHNLAHFYGNYNFPLSGESCFTCLRRKPMYCLPCGHWTCQICIRIFYAPIVNDPWLFCTNQCVLCGADSAGLRIRVKPETAAVRVLSIDGGGTRGRIPLEFLQVLQNCIGLPYPVQRNFDVVYGTSSGKPMFLPVVYYEAHAYRTGAMSVCALYINGWPIEKCIQYFEQSSRMAFEKRPLFKLFFCLFGHIPILSPVLRFIVSLLVDGKYSAEKLEAIQKEVYGLDRSIVDTREANEIGTCVGLVLTSTEDTNTFIVTNYGEAGKNREISGKYDWFWHNLGLNLT